MHKEEKISNKKVSGEYAFILKKRQTYSDRTRLNKDLGWSGKEK